MKDKDQVQKVLVVVDMQNDFIEGPLGNKETLAVVDRVAEKIKRFKGAVFVTLDTHYQNYLRTEEGKKLPVTHCIYKTAGWRLHEKVLNALHNKKYKAVKKETFASTKLADELCRLDVEGNFEIELVGVCTDICVVSNALLLKAYFPEIKISVDASCCAGVTPELHSAALQVMKSCHINIIGE